MNNKGLSLIELMVVLSVLGVLASLALPAFADLLRRQQASGQVNELFALIYLSRSEAIKRNRVVTICKSADHQQCGGSWSDGWIVFQDDNRNGSREPDEEIINAGRIQPDFTLTWVAFGSNNYIRFAPNGMTLAQNGTFTLCPRNGDSRIARVVVVSKTARVRLPESGLDTSGNLISC